MPQPNDLSRNPHRSGTEVRQTPPLLADPEPQSGPLQFRAQPPKIGGWDQKSRPSGSRACIIVRARDSKLHCTCSKSSAQYG
jgi:hypothetical protein